MLNDFFGWLFFTNKDISGLEKNDVFLILSKDKKDIIELKDVALFIWKNLEKPISFEDLLKKLRNEYDASELELKKDLRSWLKEALKEKIIKKTKNV